GAWLASGRSHVRPRQSRGPSRHATNPLIRSRVDVAKSAYAGAGPHFHPHRIVRTGLGARARIRHEAGGSFHRTIAKENRRSTADSYSALRRLYNSPVTIKILGAELKARFGRSAKVTNA